MWENMDCLNVIASTNARNFVMGRTTNFDSRVLVKIVILVSRPIFDTRSALVTGRSLVDPT